MLFLSIQAWISSAVLKIPIEPNKLSIILFVLAAIFFTTGLFKWRKITFLISILLLCLYGYINIYISNIEMLWLILSLMGVGLLIIEALVPGVQFFGIAGAIFLAVGMVQSADSIFYGLLTLFLAAIASAFVFVLFKKKGYKLKAVEKLVLHDANTSDKGYVARETIDLMGLTGVTTSVLRPTGYGEINGKKYDLYAEEGFIPEGEEVIVIGEKSMKVLVRRLTK
ncbi:MAG: NfeD family protein [Tissierellia bacterium]|nr:NfeD family protein [Tissierellia bacterium]